MQYVYYRSPLYRSVLVVRGFRKIQYKVKLQNNDDVAGPVTCHRPWTFFPFHERGYKWVNQAQIRSTLRVRFYTSGRLELLSINNFTSLSASPRRQ